MIWKLLLPIPSGYTTRDSSTSRQVVVLRRIVDHSARSSLVVDTAPTTFGIIKISARNTRYATPRVIGITRTTIVSIITATIAAASASAAVTPVTVVVTVVAIITRVRIAVVIRQRIPADVGSEREVESNERRPPPTAVPVVPAARHPDPVVVVEDPAAVVIRRPSPRFVADPRPTVWWTPGPMAVSIWRPICVTRQDSGPWPPGPAEFVVVAPVAPRREIFCSPHELVVILNVVTQALREKTFAVVHPIVNRVVRDSCQKLPIAGVVARNDELCAAVIAKRKT